MERTLLKRNKNMKPRKCALENLKKEALKYKTRTEFIKNASGAYDAARNMGVVDEICSHMPNVKFLPKKWTVEKIQAGQGNIPDAHY